MIGVLLAAGAVAAGAMYAGHLVLNRNVSVAEAAPLVVFSCLYAVPLACAPLATIAVSAALVVAAVAWTDGRELVRRWRCQR